MHRKVGIITIIDYNNYGNRLQNYATQEVIKHLGFEVETIINSPYCNVSLKDRIRKVFKMSSRELIAKIFQKVRYKFFKSRNEKRIELLNEIRTKNFKEFSSKYICETSFIITPDNVPYDIKDRYSAFIVGSDQVWNPNYRLGSYIDFLTFAPKEKRIAYAASFGVSSLPNEHISNYKRWLSEMAYISVREETGAKIIKDLIGRDVDVLIDPTLMLNKEQWLAISKAGKCKPDRPYLLTYFLAGVSDEVKAKIHSIIKETNLKVLNLLDIENELLYVADPAELLDYINSSEVVFTDSFHGVVFSILFEKPFVVLERSDYAIGSRIDTLLKKFDFNSRRFEYIKSTKDIYNINFSKATEILKVERIKALEYLKKALNINQINNL